LGFISGMPRYQRPSFDKPGEVWTDALGNFVVKLQVPKLTRGTYTIKADDTCTSATATFTINPRVILRNQYAYKEHGTSATPSETKSSANYIELFLTEGFVGDWLSLQLSGFGDGEIVEVKLGTKSLINATVLSGTQKGYGFWASAVRVPETSGGDYTVTATGKISGITASSSFKVKPELFLSRPVTPGLSSFPWVYTFDSFGKSWYSSVNATANSAFWFEATGLSGTSISAVTVAYDGGTPITCTVTGTLTIADGSTQGINASTVPFVTSSAFSVGLSPKATVPSAIPSGKIVSVAITTSGAGGASYTFNDQLFSSKPGAKQTDGTLMWVEGDSTISSDGTSLSGVVGDTNTLVATGINATYAWTWATAIYPTGSTVNKLDPDVLWGWTLTYYDQSSQPLSFYDIYGTGAWNSSDPVYIDNDNSANVTTGDQRVTLQTIGGKEYLPFSGVVAGNPDLGRPLVKFPPETRPSYYQFYAWRFVYLDKFGAGYISEGDTRISELPAAIWWTGPYCDVNGFVEIPLTIPGYPGAGLTYDIGLYMYWFDGILSSKIKMQILTSLEVNSAPTAYQSTYYVTEGSDNVYIQGKGFWGNEQLKISVGGKYMKTVTPDAYGSFSTDIDNMPALAGGEQSINATGVTTTSNKASTDVTYTPALSVSYSSPAYNLNPVTSIMVTGKGFAAGTYEIVFDGAGVGTAVTSSFTVADTGDEAGQINLSFDTPEGVEGLHIVDVVKTSDPTKSAFYGAGYFDINANTRSDDPFPTDSEFPTVLIYPSLQRMPTTTTVETSVNVTGKGLQADAAYYIWYDPRGTSTSEAVLITTTPTTVTTDAKGTLTALFQVPQSSGGTRRIWISTSPTHVDNDPVTGSTVYTSVSIRPAMTLAQSSGTAGANISVSFSGLGTGTQYQLWWYKPEEATVNFYYGTVEVPQKAILLGTVTGALYGNSTEAVSFMVPATASGGTVYSVDLTSYTDRFSVLANPVFFTVGKVSTTITLSLTPTTVTQGESVAINGVIDPAMSVNVTLFIINPDAKSTNKTVLSASSGTFTDTFKPDIVGTWQVTAKWNGNTVLAEYTSPAATVTVKPVDTTWMYAWTGIALGLIALVFAMFIILRYFVRKKSQTPHA